MSDENKKDDPSPEDALSWMKSAAGPFAKIMASMGAIEDLMGKQERTKFAIDLAPGDVIRIGHRSVFLIGVELRELDNPGTQEHGFMVQAVGAAAWYRSNDWTWQSDDILYSSPFLLFHPEQEVILERESPSGTNTLDQLIAVREKLRKKTEAKKEKWKTQKSKWDQWAWGEGKKPEDEPPDTKKDNQGEGEEE